MTISESIQVLQALIERTGELQDRGDLLVMLEGPISSAGFRPPEVAVMDDTRIGRQSDYYFIVAVFYYCLTGKQRSRFQMFCFEPPNLSGVIRSNGLDLEASQLLYEIFKKGLAYQVKKRYQSLKELQKDVNELLLLMQQ